MHILRERDRRALAEPKPLRWRQQSGRGPDESRSRSLPYIEEDPHVFRSFIITDHDEVEGDRIAELKGVPEPSSIAQNPYTAAEHDVMGELFSRGRSCAAAIIAEESVATSQKTKKIITSIPPARSAAKMHQDGTHHLWLGLHELADI